MSITTRREKSKGQAILLITVALIPLMGLAGLAIDVGYMQYTQRAAQAAADAAVLAAVGRFNTTVGGAMFACDDPVNSTWICNGTGGTNAEYRCPSGLTTATNPVQSACLYAKQNGFWPWKGDGTPSNQNVIVTSGVSFDPPPVPGLGTGSWWITARVVQKVPQLFSAVLGNRTGTVSARATAAIQPGLGCVYALDPVAPASYYQNGSTNFTANCGILVDSSDPQAMMNSGNSNISATSYNVVGGVDWHGTITPNPVTGVTPFPDPLRRMQPPSPPCSLTVGCASASCPNNSKPLSINTDTTLNPGTYCGGIWVKSGTLTLNPGRYILVGGGIGTQDSTSHLRGDGVFFYNSWDAHNDYGPIDFNANSDVQLKASKTDPAYAGILFFQDRGCCTSSGTTTMPTESFQGGATSFFEGTIYMPYSLVQFAGNPSLGETGTDAHYTVVVARRFSVQGSSTMNNNFSGVNGGNPIKVSALVE
jgi:Putative Flp pilus-assembly TadE/G-like